MRHMITALALLSASLLAPGPLLAQDEGAEEVVVTGSRIAGDDDDDERESIPAVGLRRVADFAVQSVTVTGDTREAPRRREEIYAMIRGAVERAGAAGGIDLATGTLVVEPLTLANYKDLGLSGDGRADSERATFLIKTSLRGGDAKAALDRIDAFIKSVPAVGRAEMQRTGDLALSVVAPNQYRRAIVDLVAADARATAASMGAGYAVTAGGMDRPVRWTRANLTEVFLYVPYSYQVVPVPR